MIIQQVYIFLLITRISVVNISLKFFDLTWYGGGIAFDHI